jgi:hypothetical protein
VEAALLPPSGDLEVTQDAGNSDSGCGDRRAYCPAEEGSQGDGSQGDGRTVSVTLSAEAARESGPSVTDGLAALACH